MTLFLRVCCVYTDVQLAYQSEREPQMEATMGVTTRADVNALFFPIAHMYVVCTVCLAVNEKLLTVFQTQTPSQHQWSYVNSVGLFCVSAPPVRSTQLCSHTHTRYLRAALAE